MTIITPQVSHQCAPDGSFYRSTYMWSLQCLQCSFTYPNISPYSHRVIIVLSDLQIFPCPTNDNVTCVHLTTSSNARTSDTPMASAVVHCLLEASSTETTSRVGASLCEWLDPAREAKVGCDPYCRAKVH
jgi:hypothetical protein